MLSSHSSQAVFYGLAAVLIVSIAAVDCLSDNARVPFLHTEWLCWVLLLLTAKVTQHSRHFAQSDDRNQSDKLALAIAAVCLCWTVGDARWAVPLCTPLCLLIAGIEGPRPKLPIVEAPEKSNGYGTQPNPESGLPVKGLAFTVVIALVSAALLFPLPANSLDTATGLGFLVCLSHVYSVAHGKRYDESTEEESAVLQLPAQQTAWRVIAMLSLLIMVPSNQTIEIDMCLLVVTAIIKAAQWMALFEMIRRGFLLPMSTLATFANSFMQIMVLPVADIKCELIAGVALVSLAQTYKSVHKSVYRRPAVFATACLLSMALIFRRSDYTHFEWPVLSNILVGNEHLHPVEVLVRDANIEFAALLESQSKTVETAVVEYKQRYKREPPSGFERWVELALEQNSPIIDNFDTVMHTLEPFWGITAQEMRVRALMLDEPPMAIMTITNGTAAVSKNSLVLGGFSEIITEWITKHLDMLPDMQFVINGLAEPRVIVSNDRINHLISTCAPIVEGPLNGTRRPLEIMNLGRETSWQIGTRSCPEDSPSRSIIIPEDQPGLSFVNNATHAKDWCAQPKAAVSHGLFTAPYNLKITDTLIPIFSHGKPSSSQDILYPSPDYLSGYRSGKYDESLDPSWSEKSNQLYWSGSDTGGYARGNNWRQFHRQRFVETVTNQDREVILLALNETTKQWQPYPERMAHLSDLVDVKFSTLDACSTNTCKEEAKYLPVGERDDPAVAMQHRFLFDVDGMGRTERYYHLLGSKSTVLKQTMHQEWHDDRLIPWVHYVPVSLAMDELPELLRFLASTESGQRISENIANQGREWQQRALRGEDMELAFLRILLEYGRLVGEERDFGSGYCPEGRMRPD